MMVNTMLEPQIHEHSEFPKVAEATPCLKMTFSQKLVSVAFQSTYSLRSLTAKAPEKLPGPKRKGNDRLAGIIFVRGVHSLLKVYFIIMGT